jgi:hypothetical protein
MDNYIVIQCPHCKDYIYVLKKEINCQIFRHAVYKHNLKPIDPHSSKNVCEILKKQNLIYGCGKPFFLIIKNNSYTTTLCDYI